MISRGRSKSTGNVGIGTTNPGARLQVSGGTTILEQEAWQTPTFENGWINYGSGYNSAGYFKDSMGVVHLRGLVKSGTCGATIFTLPAGYRPAARELFATIANDAIARVDVLTTGEISAQNPCSNAWLSLDGLTFRAQ